MRRAMYVGGSGSVLDGAWDGPLREAACAGGSRLAPLFRMGCGRVHGSRLTVAVSSRPSARLWAFWPRGGIGEMTWEGDL